MRFRSTRRAALNDARPVSFREAVLAGLSPGDGGLYVPETDALPRITAGQTFQDTAFAVLSAFVDEDDMSRDDLRELIERSYAGFAHDEVAPVVRVGGGEDHTGLHVLELFHGPTFAFKDVALQLLGNLFEYFLQNNPTGQSNNVPKKLTVVGATSGDTGSAAIYGLRGKANIEVFVLHPRGRVSRVQELQMTTATEPNVHNVAIDGTFDDCQNIVKDLFADEDFRQQYHLSAINSINWARIAAQIVYYFHAHKQLERLYGPDVKMQVSVPTGNFGDILAGYYARKMGAPITNLLVAVNKNDILHRFFTTGRYERLSAAHPSLSPAMDIQISSNFERYLFDLFGHDAPLLAQMMAEFKTSGVLTVTKDQIATARGDFLSATVSDEETLDAIGRYHRSGYDLCPHTAVGVVAAERLFLSQPPQGHIVTLCLATAHPAKFPEAFTRATGGQEPIVPPAIAHLSTLPTRCSHIDQANTAKVRALIESQMTGTTG